MCKVHGKRQKQKNQTEISKKKYIRRNNEANNHHRKLRSEIFFNFSSSFKGNGVKQNYTNTPTYEQTTKNHQKKVRRKQTNDICKSTCTTLCLWKHRKNWRNREKGLCADNNNQWQWDNAQRYSFTLQIISHMYGSTLIFVSSFFSVQTLSHFTIFFFYFFIRLFVCAHFFRVVVVFVHSIPLFIPYLLLDSILQYYEFSLPLSLFSLAISLSMWIEFKPYGRAFFYVLYTITQELHFMLEAHFLVIRKPLVTHAIN